MNKKIAITALMAICHWSFQVLCAQEIAMVCGICKGKGINDCSLCEGKGRWKAEVGGKNKKIECPHCKGMKTQRCWLCDGTGHDMIIIVPKTSQTYPKGYNWIVCTTCNQKGVVCCTLCGGRGTVYEIKGESAICSLCEGNRYVLCSSCNGTCGWYAKKERCVICEGNGSITCSHCNGQSWLPPEQVERAFAEVCKNCKGVGTIRHKECEGKVCKKCKNGSIVCKPCEGHGAIIVTPEPKYKPCAWCNHKGVQRCKECLGLGYKNVTLEGKDIKQ